MANGATRLVLAQAQIKKQSQTAINSAFKDENNVAIATKKIPLKNPTSNNHSK
jgi:hypothetical protein